MEGRTRRWLLRKILAEGRHEVAALLSTCTDGFHRVSMHGARCSLLNRQTDALGIPCRKVFIPQKCINDDYERIMREACLEFKAAGITQVAFGDLFLADIRAYRDRMLAEVGMTALYPVWGLNTSQLAREFFRDGFRATLVCVDSQKLDGSFAGRAYDEALLTSLPAHVDPCGENGEFHTFVHDGPIFRKPVAADLARSCNAASSISQIYCLNPGRWKTKTKQISKENPMNNNRYLVLAGMVLAAAAARLLPHPWNFTPIGAMALFGGAQFASKRAAFLLPFSALFLSDLVLGLHRLMPFVYGCFALTVCLGFWVHHQRRADRIVIASLLSSLVFFLVTNFSGWACFETYPKNAVGLFECYVAGLPFLRNGLLGDLFYSGVLFGGLALAEYRFTSLREPGLVPATA